MTKQTRKKAESVTIVWEDGEEETLACGEAGDVFVVLASKGLHQDKHSVTLEHSYASVWSGGMALFNAIMASAIQFRARLHVKHIHDEDMKMVDRFIDDALGDQGND